MSDLSDPGANPTPDAVRPGLYATLVDRPIGLLVIFVTLLVIGTIAYLRIPLQLLPSGIQGTRLSVWVNHPGSSAAENEEKVARVLEDQIRTLPDLESVFSRSGEGSVMLRVAFTGAADMGLAKAELRDRIERARPLLPDSVDRINVWSHDDGDPPVMFFALLVSERTQDMDYLVEHLVQRRLEAVDGVSRAQIWGLLDDSVRILLDEDRVKAARLDIGPLVGRLRQDNFAKPMGEVTDGGRRFLLRSDMRFRSFEEIEDYPIGNGMRLSDVAHIERVKTVRDRLTRIDGRDAYYGMVQKESTANVVEVAHGLEQAIARLEVDPKLAGRVSVEVFFDQARFIQTSLDQLKRTAIWGGGLAVLVLFAFLRRVRMTLCVALSIPVSALLAIAWENFTGGSFNVLTMTGLTLGIGMLVDNSVVVIENIARFKGQGHSGRAAAVLGVRDVGLAIALATLTSVVVFLPLIFMGQNPQVRTMMEALGVPLCVSLLFSLMVALVFLPVIAARILGRRPRWVERASERAQPLARLPVRILGGAVVLVRGTGHALLSAAFRAERVAIAVLFRLRWPLAAGMVSLALLRLTALPGLGALGARVEALGIPTAGADAALAGVVGVSLAALVAAGMLIVGVPRWRARTAGPPIRPARLAPRGNSILDWVSQGNHALLEWTMDNRLLASSLAVGAFLTVLVPISNMTIAAFGQDKDTTEIQIRVDMEDNFTLEETSEEFDRYERLLNEYRDDFGFAHVVSRFRAGGGEIELRWDERQDPETLERYRDVLRAELPKLAGHELLFSREQEMDVASRQYVHFQLRGPRADSLERFGVKAVEILRGVPGLSDVSSALEEAPEQVQLLLDKDTAYAYGVTSDIALQSVSWALRGAALPRYQEEGREVPFFIEYDDAATAGLDTLRDLEVWTIEGPVPLAAFAKFEFQRGRRMIYRWNGQTTFSIQARVSDPNRQGELVEAGYLALEALDLPRGFTLGRDQSFLARRQEEFTEMRSAMVLSVVLVFLLMGILFESTALPLSVLTTIPFAVLGAMWTLFLTGTVMDSVGWIGIIILVGVVVNNGIVLIDKIHRTRRAGRPRRDAVLEGAAARVRPILMTALTTIFGLLPMALGSAPRDGIDYRALAVCVAGGLAAATFFTLWIVPLAYTLVDDMTVKSRWLLRRAMNAGPLVEPQRAEMDRT